MFPLRFLYTNIVPSIYTTHCPINCKALTSFHSCRKNLSIFFKAINLDAQLQFLLTPQKFSCIDINTEPLVNQNETMWVDLIDSCRHRDYRCPETPVRVDNQRFLLEIR